MEVMLPSLTYPDRPLIQLLIPLLQPPQVI